jgi:hypothetical protein
MKNLIFALTVFFFLTGARAWAADKPFNSADLKDPSLCKYTSRIEHDGHADGNPRLFEDVQNIYINFLNYRTSSQYIEAFPILSSDNLALLAACALEKQLGGGAPPSRRKSTIPIYIPEHRYGYIPEESYSNDGDLLIRLGLAIINGNDFYDGLFSGKIITISAEYYRHDVHLIENLNFNCSTAFPYTDDKELLQKLLTSAITGCVNRPYFWMKGIKE